MKILMVNNYLYRRGGVETYLFELSKLLISKGHEVVYFSMTSPLNVSTDQDKYFVPNIVINNAEEQFTPRGILDRFQRVLYYRQAQINISNLIRDLKPDLVHLHNIAHYLSPSVLIAIKKMGLPTVQTLHDFKLVCPAWLFLAKGKSCERCKGHKYYNAVLYKCLKDSYMASFMVALESYIHKVSHIYQNHVDRFIVPSHFQYLKMIEHGFSAEALVEIPHFNRPKVKIAENYHSRNNYILYVGRLSLEKGIVTLVQAMARLPDIVLKIAGDGDLVNELNGIIDSNKYSNIEILGQQDEARLADLYQNAICVVVPSLCYETWGLVVQEAYAYKKPVIASNIGALQSMVQNEKTGLLFMPGNVDDLVKQITRMVSKFDEARAMGEDGYQIAEQNWSAEGHYNQLMKVYQYVYDQKRRFVSFN